MMENMLSSESSIKYSSYVVDICLTANAMMVYRFKKKERWYCTMMRTRLCLSLSFSHIHSHVQFYI